MISEIQALLDEYVAWLKQKMSLRQIDEWVEITTPYLDRHNDCLQIYAKRHENGFLLTDDGYIIDDLEKSGCKLETPKRRSLLQMTLNGFGIKLDQNRLETRATADTFAQHKHNLIQAMIAVNDIFYLASPMIATLFYEDVVAWLDSTEIRYTPKVKFTGKSGYDHLFDFVITKSRKESERIVQAITKPSKDTAQSLAFAWIDTKDVRPPDSRAYAILNDVEQPVSSAIEDALRSYELKPVLWSQRQSVLHELAA